MERNNFHKIQKLCYDNSGFTFMELIIVIAILAILSISAYTSFSGGTEKARDTKRLQDLESIKVSLENYQTANKTYPQPAARDNDKKQHAWGYRPNQEAVASCPTKATSDLKDIVFDETYCGGDILDLDGNIIGWKGVLNENSGMNSVAVAKGKSKELIKPFDARYGTIPVDPRLHSEYGTKGVGEYIYSVYYGKLASTNFSNGAIMFQLATTLEGDSPTERTTHLVGNYFQKNGTTDPETIIGSGENVLSNKQKIGQNNEKITNKSDSQKQAIIKSKISLFETEIEELLDKTGVSKEAKNSLSEASDILDDINELLKEGDLDRSLDKFNDVRDKMKEGLENYYKYATQDVLDKIKDIVRNDKTEKQKKDALKKVADLEDVKDDIINTAKIYGKNDFSDLDDESKKRQDIHKRLELLKEDEISDLKEILNQDESSVYDIVSEDLKDVIKREYEAKDDLTIDGLDLDYDDVKEDKKVDVPSAQPTKRSIDEINKLEEDINRILEDLYDVDKKKKVFNIEYLDILIDIKDLDSSIEDIKDEIENIKNTSDIFGKEDLSELTDKISSQTSYKDTLLIVLQAESKITGEPPFIIDIEFNEQLLGVGAGESGVVVDSGPLSEYNGIPYPFDLAVSN